MSYSLQTSKTLALAFGLAVGTVTANAQAILVTIAEAPGQQSSTLAGVAVFDFDSLPAGSHSNVVWEDVGVIDELLVAEGYFGFGAYDPSDGLNSRFNWNGWGGWYNDPVVSSTTITLDQPSAYFGLYWSAGDGDDIIRFYSGDTLVAEFSTQTVVDSASLTAEYYGDPNHPNQWNPYLNYNHTEPYAYINFYADDNTTWDRVVLTQTHDLGSGFETDNLSTRVAPLDPNVDDVSVIGTIIAEVTDSGTSVVTAETTSFNLEASGSGGSGSTDSGSSDSGSTDSGSSDSGSTDSGSSDSGSTDSGSDSGSTDSGSSDSGSTDSGSSDSGSTDGGSSDSGSTDSGSSDSGSTDGGGSDSGSTDGGSSDSGSTDSGSSDSGSTDSGSSDSGSTVAAMIAAAATVRQY